MSGALTEPERTELVGDLCALLAAHIPAIVAAMRAHGHYRRGGTLFLRLVRPPEGGGWILVGECHEGGCCCLVGLHSDSEARLAAQGDAAPAWVRAQRWQEIARASTMVPPATPMPAQQYQH